MQRSGDEFSLSIDEKNLTFRTQQIVHDSVFVLDDGIHLGTLGPDKGPVSARTSFRGCLADVRYNGQDIFHAFGSTSAVRVLSIGTQPSCPRLFDAESAELPLQFLPTPLAGPYAIFEVADSNEKALSSLHFDLKTVSRNAPLFSSPMESLAQSKPSVCFDIVDGVFHVNLRDGRDQRTHRSRVRVDDGRWHSIDLRFSSESGELIIDNSTEALFVGAPAMPQLGRQIRFGSLGSCDRDRSSSEILKQSVFRGCLHNIALNHRHYTLLNVSASRNLDVGCDDLCSNGQRRNGDRTLCDQPAAWPLFPEPDPFPAFSRSSSGNEKRQALVDHAIRVPEGGTVRLEPRHFYFLPPSSRIAVANRNIIFHVNQKPGHGKLTLLEHAVSTFTYQDVIDGKVNYTHDGLEQHDDAVEIELEIKGVVDGFFTAGLGHSSASANWQSQNAADHRYTLPVAVAPVNDPPVIELPNGPVLRLAQNTRMRITNQEILIMDSDHDPADVKIKVTYSTPNSGFFEHVKKPGLPATEFTQEDILNNYINYYHFGLLNGDTTLVASDPWEEGKPVTLSIHAFLVSYV